MEARAERWIVPAAIPERYIRSDVHRILVVSLDNLGDLVFASALVPPLRARYPNARITLWCKEYAADIAPLVPGVDDILAADPFWDRAPGRPKGSLTHFLRTLAQVRMARHDLAVLASSQWRVAAATALASIPIRIGLERHRNRRWLTHALPPANRSRPIVEELGRLLAPLGIVPVRLAYRLDPAPLSARCEHLSTILGNVKLAVLHPFAGDRARCVDYAVWFNVAAGLETRGFTPLWVGSLSELHELRGRTHARADWRYVDQVVSGRIADTAAAISLARLYVGHNSGPLHIASAFGVPCVGVFAAGEPAYHLPQGVGPWRLIARPSPLDISAEQILAECDLLRDRHTTGATGRSGPQSQRSPEPGE